MKMKLKLLVAALAALGLGQAAHATLVSTGDPSLVLVAFDDTEPASTATYTRILGGENEFLAADGSTETFAPPSGSIFASQFAGVASSNIGFDVFAVNQAGGGTYISTGTAGNYQGLVGSNISNVVGDIAVGTASSYNDLDNPTLGYAKANGEYTGSLSSTDPSNGGEIAFNLGVGELVYGTIANPINLFNLAADGTVTQIGVNSAGIATDPSNQKGGFFSLSSNGTVTWSPTAAVSAVPLPAAVWLMGSGLFGLIGVGRRRKSA